MKRKATAILLTAVLLLAGCADTDDMDSLITDDTESVSAGREEGKLPVEESTADASSTEDTEEAQTPADAESSDESGAQQAASIESFCHIKPANQLLFENDLVTMELIGISTGDSYSSDTPKFHLKLTRKDADPNKDVSISIPYIILNDAIFYVHKQAWFWGVSTLDDVEVESNETAGYVDINTYDYALFQKMLQDPVIKKFSVELELTVRDPSAEDPDLQYYAQTYRCNSISSDDCPASFALTCEDKLLFEDDYEQLYQYGYAFPYGEYANLAFAIRTKNLSNDKILQCEKAVNGVNVYAGSVFDPPISYLGDGDILLFSYLYTTDELEDLIADGGAMYYRESEKYIWTYDASGAPDISVHRPGEGLGDWTDKWTVEKTVCDNRYEETFDMSEELQKALKELREWKTANNIMD